jgi:hypothetical protein
VVCICMYSMWDACGLYVYICVDTYVGYVMCMCIIVQLVDALSQKILGTREFLRDPLKLNTHCQPRLSLNRPILRVLCWL